MSSGLFGALATAYTIIKRGVTSIQEIAKEVKVPAAIAAKEISYMIDSYFYSGAYVDTALGEVVLPGILNKSVIYNQGQIKSHKLPSLRSQ